MKTTRIIISITCVILVIFTVGCGDTSQPVSKVKPKCKDCNYTHPHPLVGFALERYSNPAGSPGINSKTTTKIYGGGCKIDNEDFLREGSSGRVTEKHNVYLPYVWQVKTNRGDEYDILTMMVRESFEDDAPEFGKIVIKVTLTQTLVIEQTGNIDRLAKFYDQWGEENPVYVSSPKLGNLVYSGKETKELTGTITFTLVHS